MRVDNKPLTIDQLRNMDGELVYVVTEDEAVLCFGGWCVIDAAEGAAFIPGLKSDVWSWNFESYGDRWIAYRYAPEGSENS